jgi:hypothetical protein
MRPLCFPARSSGRNAWLVASTPTTFTSSTRLQHGVCSLQISAQRCIKDILILQSSDPTIQQACMNCSLVHFELCMTMHDATAP